MDDSINWMIFRDIKILMKIYNILLSSQCFQVIIQAFTSSFLFNRPLSFYGMLKYYGQWGSNPEQRPNRI